jgi:RNA ligase
MLQVQEYLLAKNRLGIGNIESFELLKQDIGIKFRDYPEEGIVLLDYDQIESPKTHPMVIECRSLILNRNTFEVISRKFNRFFNLGEAPDFYQDFNFGSSVVLEKADGSLVGVYYNPIVGTWSISTRGMANAEGEHVLGGTFRSKVLEAFGFEPGDEEEDFQSFCNHNLERAVTYIFEYTSPENRIVKKYSKPEMVLLGATNIDGGEYFYYILQLLEETFRKCGLCVRLVKIYDKTSNIEDLREVANSLTDLDEGFVVWDASSGKRVKIKAATYLVAHKLRGNDMVPTRKNLLSLVLEGEVDEFLAYFPEWGNLILKIQDEVNVFKHSIKNIWDEVRHIKDQKEFALKVKDSLGSGFLFQAKKMKVHPLDVFKEADFLKKYRIFE